MTRGIRKQKGSKYWQIRYRDISGKLREESSGSIKKRDAETLLIRRKQEVLEGIKPELKRFPNITLIEFAPEYLKWAKRQRSYKSKIYAVSQLIEDMGNVPMNQITLKFIEQWQTERREDRGNSHATINRYLSLLKHMYTKAFDWKMVSEKTCHIVHGVKKLEENNERLRYLSSEESWQLIEECDNHLKPIVITALYTGMRKEEILSLTWDKVDLENRKIKLDITKSGKRREIHIVDTLYETLKNLRTRIDVPYVFHDVKGRRYKDIKRSFASAMERAKITNFRFHDLRHTFASQYIMATGSIRALQEVLGHSSLKMVLRYAKLSDSYSASAMKEFEKRMSKEKSGYIVGSSENIRKIESS